tara:strand:+ start:244 stop:717 length:474 start_codon:yes stop_codon:yes gene_type:complete
MYDHALAGILEKYSPEDVVLVSGGAAWADHLAVSLFLGDSSFELELYLPAPFKNALYVQLVDHYMDPGRISNYYHGKFGKKMSDSHATLRGIQRAIDAGAMVKVSKGFKARNLIVSGSDILLAYTWGEGDVPKDGGTKHTWDHSTASVKVHIPLSSL